MKSLQRISAVRVRQREFCDLNGELIMPTGTVRLHRVLRAKPEKVYRAFLDASAMAKWLPPMASRASCTTWTPGLRAPSS